MTSGSLSADRSPGAGARLALFCLVALVLAACSSTGQMAGGPATEVGPLPDQYGAGARVVGIMAFAEPGNLSDGNPDSVHLAAKLAAATIKGNPVTVVVRSVLPGGENAGSVINEIDSAGPSIVIGADGEATAAAAAKVMTLRGAPTLSLTSFADLAMNLYGAGYVPNEEAVTLVNEAAKRGLKSLAVVSAPGSASEDFTRAVLSLGSAAGVAVRPVDGSTDSQFVAGMAAMTAAGVGIDAVVFATGPARAGSMMALLRQDPRFASLGVIGNLIRAEVWRASSLLHATRISSEGVHPRFDWSEPADIVNAAVEHRRNRLRGHPVTVQVALDLPLVYVDSVLVEQALGQLLDNAAKYSPSGSAIEVEGKRTGNDVTITVSDRGCGFSAEEKSHAGERFFRGERHASAVTGAGLGLWIARSFVSANAGHLEIVSSGTDDGSRVLIHLPVGDETLHMTRVWSETDA